ncbi:hypothetical protein [Zavarzinella formosa]|uniref:hypothetical protein n=1 Tax=Zavarzinella formosa TaxID=360055 RepID=UPI000361C4C3|nr:hypothetical protein [Zavarzinella formosa]
MPKYLTIEEYHLTVRVPAGLPDEEAGEILAILESKPFVAKLRKAIAAIVTTYPPLAVVRVTITR